MVTKEIFHMIALLYFKYVYQGPVWNDFLSVYKHIYLHL